MRRTLLIVTVAASLLLLSVEAFAHHAFSAEFDANKPVKLRGNVAKMDWINPHAWLFIDVKGADGAVTSWMIELGPPNALLKRGWTKQSVPVGMEVIVDGYQSKDGALRANGRDVTLPDGRKMFAGSSNTGAPGDPGEK
jgi:Family of unknown function (DUF6152)